MKELSANDLRALLRLIPAIQTLREDVENSLHLELYTGAGDLVLRSFRGLRDQVYAITEDRYIGSLDAGEDERLKDKHRLSQVMLLSGQLLAYIEGQLGIIGVSSPRSGYHVQTSPNISVNTGDVMG